MFYRTGTRIHWWRRSFEPRSVSVLHPLSSTGYSRSLSSLWLSGFDENKTLVTHVQTLNAARKAAAVANPSFYSTPTTFYSVTSNGVGVYKAPMLALLSNKGAGTAPTWTISDSVFQAKEALVDVLTCTSMTADSNGGISATGSDGAPMIILPASALSTKGTLCPKVAAGTQASAATQGVPLSVMTLGSALLLATFVTRVFA